MISSLRSWSLMVSSIPVIMVVTSPSDLFNNSSLRLHPAKNARDEIQFNHTAHSSLFLPSYLGTAANITSYFCCWVVAAKASKAVACCCWTLTMVWWFCCWVLAIFSWAWANCSNSFAYFGHMWFQRCSWNCGGCSVGCAMTFDCCCVYTYLVLKWVLNVLNLQ